MGKNRMLEAAERLKKLRDAKEQLEDRLEKTKACLKEAEKKLSDIMAEAETPSFTHSGFQYVLTSTVQVNVKADLQDDLYAALRKNGAGDLVHDYVHPRTLASYVRSQMKANQDKAPDWIAPYLSLFPQSGVSIRSATRK